jgi:DNA-binding transcriptional ArsR family regulator
LSSDVVGVSSGVGPDGLTDQERATSGLACVEAVANPVRSRILCLLGIRPMSAAELAGRLGEPAAKVRYHLRWLRARGFVRVRRSSGRRGVQELSLEDVGAAFVDDELYLRLPPLRRSAYINHCIRAVVLDAVDYLSRLPAEPPAGPADEPRSGALRGLLMLDQRGWTALAATLDDACLELMARRRAAAPRLEARGGPALEASAGLLYLERSVPAPRPGPSDCTAVTEFVEILTPIGAQIYRRAAPQSRGAGVRAGQIRDRRAAAAAHFGRGGEMATHEVRRDGLTDAERATSGRAYVEAVSNPVRSRLLALLGTRPMSIVDLAARIGEPAAKVRYHVRWLRERGFVRVRDMASRRGVTEHLLEESAVGYLDDALYAELEPRRRTAYINHCIRSIVTDATAFVRDGSAYDDHFPGALRLRLRLDEQGWREMAEVMDAAGRQVMAIRRAAEARLAAAAETPILASVGLLYLEHREPEGPAPGRPDAPDS